MAASATPSTSQQAQVHELLRCQDSFRYFLSTYVRITDARRGVIPFEMWPCHVRACQALEAEKRIVVLKARQIGMSWLFGAAYPLWITHFHPNRLAMLFSMRDDEAGELIRKCRMVWSHLPDWMRVPLAKDNSLELEFAGMESRILAFPSSPSAGSSYSANYVLSDEHAKQTYAQEQFASISPTIDMGGQYVSLSSANGPGTFHAHLWHEAVSGKNRFCPLFFPYDSRPGRDEQWWEDTKATYPEEWLFFQEYPRAAEEAIQSSTPRRFPDGVLQLLASTTEPCPAELLAQSEDPDLLALRGVRARTGELGCRFYQLPRKGVEYVIGADVAEGNANGDAHAAVVLDRTTGEEVAVLHGRWAITDFAVHLDHLANAYGALLGIERNNHGAACILAVMRLQQERAKHKRRCKYTLYYEKPILDAQGRLARPGKPGWLTTVRTKPTMFVDLENAMREADIRLASQAILEEMRMIVDLENGRVGAAEGYHDDLVIATAIAWQMVTRTRAPRERPRQPYAIGQHAKQLIQNFDQAQRNAPQTDPFARFRQKRPPRDRTPLLQRLNKTGVSPRVPAW